MQYIGGKQKSGGHKIAALLRLTGEEIIEPFCGGLSVTSRLHGLKVEARDLCEPLISLYQNLQKGWVPPEIIERDTWEKYKKNPDPKDPMTAFVGFGCSRSGAWFSSFIEDYKYTKKKVPAATAAKNSLLKKIKKCSNVKFVHGHYQDSPIKGVWYCDPPYKDSVGYSAVGDFDSEKFWGFIREVSSSIPVFISEKISPDDFIIVEEWSLQNRLNSPKGGRRVEKVFIHEKWNFLLTSLKKRSNLDP